MTTCFATGLYDIPQGQGVHDVSLVLLVSTDGGFTWTRKDVPGYLQVADTNALGKLVCPTTTTCAVGYGTTIFTTHDAGTTWATATPDTDGSGTPASGALSSFACGSATDCVAVGFDAPDRDTAVPLVVSTADGGFTWTKQAVPFATGQLSGVSCSGPGTCSAVGTTHTEPFQTYTADLLASTTTNGTSWSAPETMPALTDFVGGFACPAAGTCLVAGSNSPDGTNLVTNVTPDGGATWTTALVLADGNYASLVCTAIATCLATFNTNAGLPMIGETSDGGATWSVTGLPLTRLTTGYYEVASDGGVFAFDAPFYGSMGGHPLNQPVVGMAVNSATTGYYEVAADGGVFAFDAPFYGSMGGRPLNQPIVGMATTPDGGGYWLVARDGGIFAFGDAPFYGSMGGHPLNQPIVGMSAVPAGDGYYEVAADGGIFCFGNAPFEGSVPGHSFGVPNPVGVANWVGSAVATPFGGYWVVSDEGVVVNFGSFAGFYGSVTNPTQEAPTPLARPIVGMATSSTGLGYFLVAGDGGLFSFGDAPFFGSMGGQPLNAPVVGMAVQPLDAAALGILGG